ncbi:MAG: hypothetical protein K2I90_08050, partial [Odoribacter sp.]|nr:hypothetical protein [Odoribacter sp.]
VVSVKVGTNRAFSRDKNEVMKANNQIKGVLVESVVPADFTWTWSPNSSGSSPKPLPAFHTTTTSSYMSIHRDTFPGIVNNGRLICVVRTRELGCQQEVSVPLTVEGRPSSGIASNTMTVNTCGQYAVKDSRDDQIYTTVRVGKQCWMAENMRYKDASNRVNGYGITYSSQDPRGTILGVFYYARIEAVNGICPEGWVVPSTNDYVDLINYANNNGLDEYGRYRLRAGNFWLVARADRNYYANYIYAKEWNYGTNPTGMAEGFNTLGFGLMGSSYHTYNHKDYNYNYNFLLTRTIRSNPYVYAWHMHLSNHEFQRWENHGGYYFPARCILQSTSRN